MLNTDFFSMAGADGETSIQKNKVKNQPTKVKVQRMLADAWCLEDKPVKILFEDITSAAFKLKDGICKTPCVKSQMSSLAGVDLYLKKEFLQLTGSYKDRGARHALMLLSEEDKRKGAMTASLGNYAQALCYHGMQLNIPVTVFMPVTAPLMKIQKCRIYGGNIYVKGKDTTESKIMALKMARDTGATYINGYDHPHVLAGCGTIGLEIAEQVPDVDAVIVPIGGGGLLAGITVVFKALKPNVQVIGVEVERCPSFTNALKIGKPVYTACGPTLADGLAVPKVGYNAFETASKLVDKVVLVKEEWIALSILRFAELEKCIIEGAGATGLAAILSGQLPELKGKKVVLILTGGNIDTTIFGRCLERGLAADGRLMKFTVTLSDRPGTFCELCNLLATNGANVKDISHERTWTKADIFSVELKVVCETRDLDHANEVKQVLAKNYQKIIFTDIRLPLTGEIDEPLNI